MGDPASTAATGLYALGGNVLRQYGPAAVALGSALLNPTASMKKSDKRTTGSRAIPTESVESGYSTSSTSTVTSPASYSVPPKSNRSVSAGNPSSLGLGQPSRPSGMTSAHSMHVDPSGNSERFEKIGKHELGGMNLPATPGGSKWWWNKEGEGSGANSKKEL